MPRISQMVMAIAFAVPCFSMGLHLLRVWRQPMAVEGGRWVTLGVGVFVLEFILVHASVLLGALATAATGTGERILATMALATFYGLFVGAIALGFRSRMLLMSFVWLIVGRFVALAIGISEQDASLLAMRSAAAVALYVVLVMASIFLPVPRLGITPEIAAATRLPNASGVWIDEPHRAVAAATVYFLALGLFELTVMTWIDARHFDFP